MERVRTSIRWITAVLMAAGIALLAAHPGQWLVRSWVHPAYQSQGGLVFVLFVALLGWSVSSPLRADAAPHRRRAVALLGLTAAVRLGGQVLDIGFLGALALAVDAYALALYLGLDQRRRAVSPAWLAVLFSLTLPLERVVQRLVGYGLQHVSAAGACGALSMGFDDLRCEGVRIVLAGRDILVDLPCSGARGLYLLMLLLATCGALSRPRAAGALAGVVTTLGAALAANSLRIAVLAVGLAYPAALGGIDVMGQPWHDLIGLVTLALGAAPVVVWARTVRSRSAGRALVASALPQETRENSTGPAWRRTKGSRVDVATRDRTRLDGVTTDATRAGDRRALPLASDGALPGLGAALGFCVAAGIIIALPGHPIDVARPMPPLVLPAYLAGEPGRPDPLTALERRYFTQYGGSAARTTYGERVLLVVRTSAPIRHMHAPDECLTGAGHDVDHVGIRYGRLPAAVYRSVTPDGHVYRVAVTYVSDDGQRATSLAEVAWRWTQAPGTTWTAYERVSPWTASAAGNDDFDEALIRAFDLPVDRGVSALDDAGATLTPTPTSPPDKT